MTTLPITTAQRAALSKERPIIFSAQTVRAILAGTKTQTRRLVTLAEFDRSSTAGYDWDFRDRRGRWNSYATKDLVAAKCPYGVVGERLWVRETWTHDAADLDECRAAHEDQIGGLGYGPYYKATEVSPDTLLWRSPLFMPRWASRISLEIVSVRVERLHAISESDAQAEGIESRAGFAGAWDTINAKRAPWSSNPWVWVVEFQRSAT